MSSFAFAWRDYEPDTRVLVWCVCGHASQIHNTLGCTAGPVGYPVSLRRVQGTQSGMGRACIGDADAICSRSHHYPTSLRRP